jgi:hypothetical protein
VSTGGELFAEKEVKVMRFGTICAGLVSAGALAVVGCVAQDSDGDGQEEVSISAECSWYAGATCEAECDGFDFWASCEGQFDVTCDPECDQFDVDIECSGSCEADCATTCTDPGSFDCEGYCSVDCNASCEAECAASASGSEAQAECTGHCGAYCEGKCGVSCDVELPDCTTACSASCEGECSAEANIDCHLCDAEVYVDCEANMDLDCHGGCDVDGVLECDGDYITRDDLEAAVQWVEDNTDFEITYDGSASCEGNSCEAEGTATFTCDAAQPGREARDGLLAAIFSAL